MPDALDVAVAGGSLRVATWPGTGTPVLAIHGITSSSRSWPLLAQHLDQPVVAPDLRGRGRSNQLPGPVGLVAHADDCAGCAACRHYRAGRRGRPLDGRLRRHGAGCSAPRPRARARPGRWRPAVPTRGCCGDPRRPPADQGPAADDVHPGELSQLVPWSPGVRPRLDPRGRGVRRLRPARRSRPPERRPRGGRGRPARHAREHRVRRRGRAPGAPARLPARPTRLRRRPARALPAVHRRRLRRPLARSRRAARARRQPLHDRAESSGCRRGGPGDPRPGRREDGSARA